jgi:hypothetical protein
MQKFKYRAPRYAVDFPVELSSGSSTLRGRCREISKDGMRVELSEPLPADFNGIASLTYQSLALKLRVEVAPASVERDGVKFLFETQKERAAIAQLVAVLAARAPGTGPMLVE